MIKQKTNNERLSELPTLWDAGLMCFAFLICGRSLSAAVPRASPLRYLPFWAVLYLSFPLSLSVCLPSSPSLRPSPSFAIYCYISIPYSFSFLSFYSSALSIFVSPLASLLSTSPVSHFPHFSQLPHILPYTSTFSLNFRISPPPSCSLSFPLCRQHHLLASRLNSLYLPIICLSPSVPTLPFPSFPPFFTFLLCLFVLTFRCWRVILWSSAVYMNCLYFLTLFRVC